MEGALAWINSTVLTNSIQIKPDALLTLSCQILPHGRRPNIVQQPKARGQYSTTHGQQICIMLKASGLICFVSCYVTI